MEKFKPIKRKKSFSNNTTVDIFVRTQIFSVIVYALVFIIVCSIALAVDLSSRYDLIFSLAGFMVCSFAVGFYTGRKLRQNGLLSGILYSLPINTLVILISLFLCDFSAGINIVITAIALLISAALGGVVAVNSRLKR